MQSTIYYKPSSSHNFQYPWKSSKNPACKTFKASLKSPSLASSLRSQITYELEGGVNNDGIESSNPTKLPVVIRRYGKVSRYFWDGNRVQLLSVDGGGSSGASFCFNLDKVVEASSLAVRNFFIPKQVSENYTGYVKWKFLHRVFSSALQVLATQAMFRAIGFGYSRSLTSAAALNWVLKDGLGRLSRCIYTASLASAFDTNLKRVRFSTSLLFTLSIGVELFTPIFPQHFLLLASLANVAKQMSLACYMATSPPIHRSFAIAGNLAEVSAKSQIQSVCFDNLGLMLAAVLNLSLKNNQRLQAGLPFILYPIFSAVDLFGIYQGLKYVHLQTLTKDRIEIIIDTWISFGYVPSPEEVSKDEGINFMWTKGNESWRIRIGCLNPKGQLPKLTAMAMQSVCNEDYYFICTEIFYRGLARTREQGILLCVHEGARTVDVIMGLLQACYVRKALRSSMWESMMKGSDSSDLVIKEWFKLIDDSKQYVQRQFGPMNKQMVSQGWGSKNILLNTEEQTRYSYMDD
ncbi:Protein root UVB sensitive 4 [Hibiscus syriacus]|uniref:Protein root UVB sensitive 4 n=1 Tax=Hibiscus syriacus TaxID=106335 RepID=A0A6A3AUH5_HIBSY|nr:protein root UVB sensitive 4-like [Hibiscus syriacus]KAE8707067.1 Protein root UVB sensitive 4 [Hibiscus syriacus]